MLIACDHAGLPVEPDPGRQAVCPECQAVVFARCGDWVVWHFAHLPAPRADPCSRREVGVTDWHLFWQSLAPVNRREVALGRHRTDVIAGDGRCVEFQHSSLRPEQVRSREAAYLDHGRGTTWIADGRQAVRRDDLIVWRPDFRARVRLLWRRAPMWLDAAAGRVLIDLGGVVLEASAGRRRPTDANPRPGPYKGWGRVLGPDQVARWLVTGEEPAPLYGPDLDEFGWAEAPVRDLVDRRGRVVVDQFGEAAQHWTNGPGLSLRARLDRLEVPWLPYLAGPTPTQRIRELVLAARDRLQLAGPIALVEGFDAVPEAGW